MELHKNRERRDDGRKGRMKEGDNGKAAPQKNWSRLTSGLASSDIGSAANSAISGLMDNEDGEKIIGAQAEPHDMADGDQIVAATFDDGAIVAASPEDGIEALAEEGDVVMAEAASNAGDDGIVQAAPFVADAQKIIIVAEGASDDRFVSADEMADADNCGEEFSAEDDASSDLNPIEDDNDLVL